MDSFVFDLQLFGNVDVTLPESTSGTQYYALTGDPEALDWVSTKPASAEKITAMLKDGVLSVKISDSDAAIRVTGASGKDITVSAAAGFTADGGDAFKPVGASSAKEGTVAFVGTDSLSVAVKTGDSDEANTNASTVKLGAENALTVSDGVVVTAATKEYTAAADGTTLNLTVVEGEVTGVAKLAAGSVKIAKEAGAVATNAGATITNTSDGTETITVSADGAVTAVEASAKTSIVIPEGGSATFLEKAYKAAGTGEATITTSSTNTTYANSTVTVTDGSVAIDAGIKVKTDDAVVTNTVPEKGTDTTVTVAAGGKITAVAENGVCEVQLASNGNTITLVEADETEWTYEATDNLTLTVKGLDKIALKTGATGSVKIGKGAKITSGDALIENTSTEATTNAVTVADDGTIAAMDASAKCSVTLANTQAVTFGTKKYTATGNTVLLAETSAMGVTLDSGTVSVVADAKVTADGVVIENLSESTGAITVANPEGATNATVTGLKNGVKFKVEETEYDGSNSGATAASNKIFVEGTDENLAAVKVDVAGNIVVGKGVSVLYKDIATIANTSTGTETITVDKSGAVTAIPAGATFTVKVGTGDAVTYTATTETEPAPAANSVGLYAASADAFASVSVSAAGVTSVGAGVTVVLEDGTKVTNNSTGDQVVTISADNKITVEEGGLCSVVVKESGTVKIGTTPFTYTNEAGDATMTLSVTGTDGVPTVAVTAGKASIAADEAVLSGKGVTVANKAAKKVIVDVTGEAADAAAVTTTEDGNCSISIAGGKSAVIDDKTYTNASATDAAVITSVSKAATLTGGSVTVGNGAELVAAGVAMTVTAEKPESGPAPTLTVDKDGAVSAIGNGVTFTTDDSTNKRTFVMKDGTLAKTGKEVEIVSGVTGVAASTGVITGTTVGLELVLEDASATSGMTYYAVDYAGNVTLVEEEPDATKTNDKVVGYFTVTTTYGADNSTVTVTFTGDKGNATTSASNYSGNVTVDAKAVANVTDAATGATAHLKTLTVTGISEDTTSNTTTTVTNLYKKATATGIDDVSYIDSGAGSADLTVAWRDGIKAENGYGYYATIGATSKWYDTIPEIEADAASKEKSYKIVAAYTNKVLTVAIGADGKIAALDGAGVTAANLKGVTVKLTQTLAANSAKTDVVATDGTDISGTLAFGEASDLNGLAITVATGGTGIVFDGTNASWASVPGGSTVVLDDGTAYTTADDSEHTPSVLALTPSSAPVLVAGTLVMPENATVKVGSNVYKGATKGTTTTISATAKELNNDGTVKTAAEIGTLEHTEASGGTVTTPGVVTLGQGSKIYVVDSEGNKATVTATTKTATLNSNGVISGLADTQAVTISDGENDATTYTMASGAKTVTVTGSYVGVYTYADAAAFADATITSVYGKQDTLSGEPTLTPYNNTFIPTQVTKDTAAYYAVKADGTFGTADTLTNAKAAGIGYFKVEIKKDGGEVKTVISFHDSASDTDGSGTASLLAGIKIDLSNLDAYDKAGTPEAVTAVDVTGISVGKIALTEVPATVARTKVSGLKTDDALVYETTYALEDGFKITIPSNTDGTGTVWKYDVSADTDPDEQTGVKKYHIGTGTKTPVPPAVTGPAFTVTKTIDGGGNVTYAVAYVPAAADTDGLQTLSDPCWAGIVVDAANVPAPSAAVTSTVAVTVNAATGQSVYTINANVGVIVNNSGKESFITPNWTGAGVTTISYKDKNDAALESIVLPNGTGSTVTYWKVEAVANDGNNKITITEQTTAPVANTNYIKVAESGKKVTVSYIRTNSGTPTLDETADPTIALSDLMNGANAVQVAITTPEDFAGTEIDITDAGKKKANCVDFAVTAPAGTKITGENAGDTKTWLPGYKNEVVIDLDALQKDATLTAGTYYYEVSAEANADDDGWKSVKLANATPTKAEEVPDTTKNYFVVTKADNGVYTVTYQIATSAAAGVEKIDLTTGAGKASGKATLSVNGNADITSISVTTTATKCNGYTVTNATDSLATLDVDSAPQITNSNYVTFVATSKFTGTTTFSLGDSANFTSTKDLVYYITKNAATTAKKGVTEYDLLATTAAGESTLKVHYVAASAVPAYIEVVFTKGDNASAVTQAELADIANAITLDATILGSNTTVKDAAKIVLTDDTKGAIAYKITGLDAGIALENFTEGKDTVAYAKSFVMGAKDTITLSAGTGTKSVAYYAVTATDGKDTKNVRTVTIEDTPTATATDGTITKDMAAALAAKGNNYFRVTTATDGSVTVDYVMASGAGSDPIDLTGKTVKVDANAVTVTDTTHGSAVVDVNGTGIVYAVSGLEYDQTIDKTGAALTSTATYNTTYEISGDIALTNAVTGAVFYSVVAADSTVKPNQGRTVYKVAAADEDAKGNHYFKVQYAATGISITYYNVDGKAEYNLADVMPTKQVAVDTTNINEAITAINITDGGDANTPKANYAVTIDYTASNVNPALKVVGAGEGDTVTTTPTTVLAADQKITLTDYATTYYVVSEQSVGADGKVTVTIGAGTNVKPADTANYFVVTRTEVTDGADDPTGKVSYEIDSYHESNGAAIYDLSGKNAGVITIDATKATGGITLNNAVAPTAHYAVTNLPEYTPPVGMYVNGGGEDKNPSDTVSYSTTFTWATETVPKKAAGGVHTYTYKYLVAIDADGKYVLTPGETATTSLTDTKTEYAVVTVSKDSSGKYTLAVDANAVKVQDATGAMTGGSAVSVTSIVAPTTAAELDVSGVTFVAKDVTKSPTIPNVTGVAANSTVTIGSNNVTVITDTLENGETVDVKGSGAATTFTAGGSGQIAITGAGGALNVESGVLVITKADGTVSSSTTTGAGISTDVTLTTTDGTAGQVIVTFTKGKGITSITGLDANETLTVTENGTTPYTYTVGSGEEAGYIIKATGASKWYASSGASGTETSVNIAGLGYDENMSITGVVGEFEWNPTITPPATKTYYLAASATEAVVTAGSGTGNVEDGSYYLMATFDSTGKLKITPVRGNAKRLVDPVANYSGTITMNADGAQVTYEKTQDAAYTVHVTGAKAGSTFTYLGDSDTVTTKELTKNTDKITVNALNDATPATPTTYIYRAGADGTMEFKGKALTKGTAVISDDTNETTIFASDGSKIAYSDTSVNDSVSVVIENGAIKTITGLNTAKEAVTITKDGVTTAFVADDAIGNITKTVTVTATGETTVTKFKLTTPATDDVWNVTSGTTKVFDAFTWAKGQTGYFVVPQSGATAGEVAIATGGTAEEELTDGKVFVKLTVTDVATTADATKTFTLTPMIVSNGVLTEAPATGVTLKKVTIDAGSDTVAYTDPGKRYNISVTNAGAGSVFTDLLGGDVVATKALNIGDKVTVNGKAWTAVAGEALTIYSESQLASRIVSGTVNLTSENTSVNAATLATDSTDADTTGAAKATQTLTYTAGTGDTDAKDGVQVVYAKGVPTSITGLGKGERVTVVAEGETTVTTTYTTADNGAVVYRTRGTTTTYATGTAGFNVVGSDDATGGATYAKTESTTLEAFDWTAATASKAAEGYFAISSKGAVNAETRTTSLATDYTQYGNKYLYVRVTSTGGLTLNVATVGMNGKLGSNTTILTGDAIDATLTLPTAGLKLTNVARGNLKSLTILNAAAGTTATSWTEADTIKTVSLKAASGTTAAETVTLGAKTYVAGASGVMEITGSYVKQGTIQISKDMTTLLTSSKDETTEATTVDAVTYTKKGGISSDTANIGVSNGRVVSLTGFGDKESIEIVTTTTDKYGVEKTSKVTYTAALIEGGLNDGQIKVTRTDEDNNSATHVFKNTDQNVMADGITWTDQGQDVSQVKFNWNNTAYFKATISSDKEEAAKKIYKADTVKAQGTATNPQPGNYYLKVTATKAMSGLVTISALELVKMQDNGTFAAVKSGENLQEIVIDASATEGLVLPETHTAAKLTITPAMNKTYTGLAAGDTLVKTDAAVGDTITVDGKAYETRAASFTINGDKTIEQGTFRITDTATASADPAYGADTVTKAIAYSADSSVAAANKGVDVVFAQNPLGKGSEITSVTGLGAGEQVVVTSYIGTAGTVDMTTTIKNVGGTVTKTISKDAWPADVVMTKASDAVNDLLMKGYKVVNKFDFGATDAGAIAFLDAGQAGDSTAFTATDGSMMAAAFADLHYYAAIGATKNATTKDVTINYLEVYKYTDASGVLSKVATSELPGVFTIDAKAAEGNLRIADDAAQLYQVYYDETHGGVKPTDAKYGTLDEESSDKKRGYTLNVTNAVAGKAYKGFAENDTITGTLKAAETITVGDLTYALAEGGTVTFDGSGAATGGKFTLNSAYKEVQAFFDNGTKNDVLTSVTGSATTAAEVEVSGGKVTSIAAIGAGETVTMTETDTTTKAVTTTKYTATLNADGKTLTIARETTKDGVTTTSYCKNAVADLSNIVKLTYGEAVATLESNFDWTAANGSFYYVADVTLDGSTVKDIGTIPVKPGTTRITADDKGKYVVKATVTTDGKIDALTLHQVKENGELDAGIAIPATATGTLTIEAPTASGLTFDKTNYAGLTVAITGAQSKSEITKLSAKDTLTTATLAPVVYDTDGTTVKTAAEYVTVNGNVYTAGASTTMKFVGAGVMTDGVLAMSAQTIETTGALAEKYSDSTKMTVQHTGTDTPIVTVKDGVVVALSDLKTGSVTTRATATGATATYQKNAVTVALPTAKTSLVTLAMAAGDTVKFGTHTAYSGAANNKIEFATDTSTAEVLVKNGYLKLAGSENFTVTGSLTDDNADNVKLTYTKTTSTDVTVKVTNGEVTSVKGLKAGDVIELAGPGSKVTTYKVDASTPTKVTKTVAETGKDTLTYTGFITEGADILAANYFGAGSDITEEENQIVGQLSWGDVSGRATGYFQVKSNKTTIQEQSQKVTVKADRNKTALYAVANAKTAEDTAGTQVLTIDAMQVATDSQNKTTITADGAGLLEGSTITVTAPTAPLSYNKTATYDTTSDATKSKTAPTFAIVLNKVAAGSVIQNIDLGDKVTTATLAIGEKVSFVEPDDTTVEYVAGAKGALTFVGEGESVATTSTAATRLLKGTISLAAGKSAYLAGGAETKQAYSGNANDLKVTATGDDVLVTVKDGKVSTIANLDVNGAYVEVTTDPSSSASATSVKYTVVDVNNVANTVTIERVEGKPGDYAETATKSYRTVTKGKDFYSGDQSKTFKAAEQDTPTLADWTTKGTKVAFVNLSATASETDDAVIAATTAKDVTSDAEKAAFTAKLNTQYLRLTVNTNEKGVTTFKAVDLMEASATGNTTKLQVLKQNKYGYPRYDGTLTIDGAMEGTGENAGESSKDGKLNFALPVYGTKRFWNLNAKNVQLGSTFTNLAAGDLVQSAYGEFVLSPSAKTLTVYTNGSTKNVTNSQTITYAGPQKESATVTVAKDAARTVSIKGLTSVGEKVTIASDMDDSGLVTTVYEVDKTTLKVKKTTTYADGSVKEALMKATPGAETNILDATLYGDETQTQIVSDFNWTLDKAATGYFEIKSNAAAVKTTKTTIKKGADAKQFLKVKLREDSTQTTPIVESIEAVTVDSALNETAYSFTGTATITAPAMALTFDRAVAGTSIADSARFVLTNVAAKSTITGLKARSAYAQCDTVTTAKLAKNDWLTVAGNIYTAGADGALGFTMQQVNGTDDERATLTSGTISLWGVDDPENDAAVGANAAVVGKVGVTAKKAGTTITVAAKTTKSGTTTYTVGSLDVNDSFQVTTYGSETVTSTFVKSTSALFYKADGAATDEPDGKYIYALKGKTSVASSILTVAGKIPTAKGWQAVKETFTAGTDDFLTTTYGTVTVDLATLDKRYAADKKANNNTVGSDTYAFVIDTYLAGTAAATTKALNAAVVQTRDTEWQTLIGDVSNRTATTDAYVYKAYTLVGQTIKATNNWSVTGSNTKDAITGASSGTDTLIGGLGDDTLTGGNAADTFVFSFQNTETGRDTVKKFGNGKDKIAITDTGTLEEGYAYEDGFKVNLNGANVEIWHDKNDDGVYDSDEHGVTLEQMGNKKAVNINGLNYYFGSGKTAKPETFTFDVSDKTQSGAAKYYGKANLANTLSVGTDKTKATAKTLGDALTVDLSDATRYVNIASADASKSTNRVDLTAAATGSTLKGGTYQSTLRGGAANDMLYGGSGVDVFWAADLSGSDTVKNYQTSKDAVFLGNIDADPDVATEVNDFTIQVSGKHVTLTKGDASMTVENAAASATKAFKISKDGTSTNTLSYYVGSTTARANNFVATMDVDMKTATETVDEKTVTTVSMSSYYLGASTATTTDTLKLSSKTKNANIGQFNMNTLDKYISTIDVIDTAGLAKGSTIELIGREHGSYTLKGSGATENFNLSKLAQETDDAKNNVTISNLTVNDLITLGDGITATKTTGASTKNTYFKLTDKDGNSYGTLTVTGVASSKFGGSYTGGTFTRTK